MNLFKRAAQLRRKNKKLTVPASVKKAAAELRKTKKARRVGSTKFIERGENKNSKPSRVYQVKRTKAGLYAGAKRVSGMPVIAGLTVSQTLAQTRRVVLAEIGALEAKKYAAKTKRDKAKIAKLIAAKKSIYRKIS